MIPLASSTVPATMLGVWYNCGVSMATAAQDKANYKIHVVVIWSHVQDTKTRSLKMLLSYAVKRQVIWLVEDNRLTILTLLGSRILICTNGFDPGPQVVTRLGTRLVATSRRSLIGSPNSIFQLVWRSQTRARSARVWSNAYT